MPKQIGTSQFNPLYLHTDLQSLQEPVKVFIEGDAQLNGTKQRKSNNPVQRIESIIRKQRLETAWLQASEKGTPGSLSRLKPERNQVLPQDGTYHHHNQMQSMNSVNLDSSHWEDELNREINVLKINYGKPLQKDQIVKRIDHYPMSPSLLHDSCFVDNFTKKAWDMNQDQEVVVAVGFSVGITPNITKEGRLNWEPHCVCTKEHNFYGLENVQSQGG